MRTQGRIGLLRSLEPGSPCSAAGARTGRSAWTPADDVRGGICFQRLSRTACTGRSRCTRRCDAQRRALWRVGHQRELVGNLVSSDGDTHAPNRAERLQPRTHRAGLDMSQLSMRSEERSRCLTARRSPIQASGPRNAPYMRFRSPADHMVGRLQRGPTGAASAKLGA
jgi:hypothetical protein